MSHRTKLLAFADRFGWRLVEEASEVSIRDVECIVAGQKIGRCNIAVSVDAQTRKLLGVPDQAPHAAEVRLHGVHDGLVYDQDGARIENTIRTDKRSVCCLSIKLGSPASPIDYDDAYHCLVHYAKVIVGPVHAMRNCANTLGESSSASPSVFETRAGLHLIQNKVRGSSIAILGLGGTGSYILDLMIKTPVARIHIYDDDNLEEWNTFRSPGAPDKQDLATMYHEKIAKVAYYEKKYRAFRPSVVIPHTTRADAQEISLLPSQDVTFAFVAIDPKDGRRQDEVYAALDDADIPFIDVGMNVRLEDEALEASLQVFSSNRFPKGAWRYAIPNADMEGGEHQEAPYRNSQIADLNALNAALAVCEWRRITQQFDSSKDGGIIKFKTREAKIVSRAGAESAHA